MHVLQSNLAEFRGDVYLCELGKEYLNASLYKFVVYSLLHSETFDISHVFLPLTISELSMLKQVQFFWPTLNSDDVAAVSATRSSGSGGAAEL